MSRRCLTVALLRNQLEAELDDVIDYRETRALLVLAPGLISLLPQPRM
jgi:hypothetical protein